MQKQQNESMLYKTSSLADWFVGGEGEGEPTALSKIVYVSAAHNVHNTIMRYDAVMVIRVPQ